jgi:hypothetical protein
MNGIRAVAISNKATMKPRRPNNDVDKPLIHFVVAGTRVLKNLTNTGLANSSMKALVNSPAAPATF